MDISIQHKAGKKHINTAVLSRSPRKSQISQVATKEPEEVTSMDLDEVRRLQKEQSDSSEIIVYLTTGNLPEDERASRRIILESKQFSCSGWCPLSRESSLS